MDIAAMSMNLSSTSLQMGVGISMAKKAMDQQQTAAHGLMKLLETAVPPSDHKLDIKV